MPPTHAERLEMYQAFRTTFGDKVSETFIEEFAARDQEIVALREDIKRLDARFDTVDERFNGVLIRFDAIDTRLASIESWIRVMVLGFLGFASSSIFLVLQLR